MSLRAGALALLAGVCAAPAGEVRAQNYPVRPIRLIVPFSPGGATDFMARLLAKNLAERFGQQVVVDNRAGASSTIGTEMAARAAPDGYTLLIVSATHAVNVSLLGRLPYDAETNFAAVSLVGIVPFMLVVHPSLPVSSVRDLIRLAKARPGQLNYASSGSGSTPHLAAELFKAMTGVDVVHVPYKGAGPSLVDVIAGQVEILFATPLSAQPHLKSGRLRGLAVTSTKRARGLPRIPTIAESGVPGYESGTWHGVLAPAGTPAAIVSMLSAGIARVVAVPQIVERIGADGVEPVGSTPEAFAAYLRSEIEKWRKVIRQANIRAD